MGYLKPALSNLALIKRDWLEIWLGYGAKKAVCGGRGRVLTLQWIPSSGSSDNLVHKHNTLFVSRTAIVTSDR